MRKNIKIIDIISKSGEVITQSVFRKAKKNAMGEIIST